MNIYTHTDRYIYIDEIYIYIYKLIYLYMIIYLFIYDISISYLSLYPVQDMSLINTRKRVRNLPRKTSTVIRIVGQSGSP